jgi:hypothetical protein
MILTVSARYQYRHRQLYTLSCVLRRFRPLWYINSNTLSTEFTRLNTTQGTIGKWCYFSSNSIHRSDDSKVKFTPNTSSDKIADMIKDINEYIKDQKQAIQFFQYMMTIDPKASNDPSEFVACRDELKELVFGRLVPKIYEEFDATQFHPAIKQSTAYSKLTTTTLHRGYYNAKCHPWMIGWTMIQGNDEFKNHESFYIQRFGGNWRYHVVQNDPTIKVGTMIMYDKEKEEPLIAEYHRDLRTHFSNSPTFPNAHVKLGTTHIALGFNDLQILLHHVDEQSTTTDESQLTSTMLNHSTPMNFIGYDRSTYSIAKTLVIAHMLRQQSVTPHHIVEAWYSSTWNYETFMLFRYACITLLNDNAYIDQQQSSQSYPKNTLEEIRKYLHYWAFDAIPISSNDAILRWLYESCGHGHVYTQTCSFHRLLDRTALLQYFTTGEFGSNMNKSKVTPITEMVGSLAMWNVPAWAPNDNKTDQHRVNNTVLLQSILDEIKDNETDITIVDAMYNIKIRQIAKLQQLVQSEQIKIDIRYGDVQPLHRGNIHLIDEIRDAHATTMSWSNLMDYLELTDFHELAQYWSSNATTHYGYTMNWPTICFGTSISDYRTRKERKEILFDTLKASVKNANKSGARQLITVPTFEHTEDQTGDLLGQRLRPVWVDYFRDQAIEVNASLNIVKDEMQLYSPILRTNRSIYLTWTYQ